MIPWIQVYSNLPQHPKTARLADELGLSGASINPNAQAVGMIVSLWTWASQNAYNGDLSGCSIRAIAEACMWKKKPETLVKALKKAGFLDEDMKLHDWEEHSCLAMEQEESRKAKNRERVRRYRERKAAAEDGNGGVTDGVTCNAYCNVTNHYGNENVMNPPYPPSSSPPDPLSITPLYPPAPNHTEPNQTENYSAGGDGAWARAQEEVTDFCMERGLEPAALIGATPELIDAVRNFTRAMFDRFANRQPTEVDVGNVFRHVIRTPGPGEPRLRTKCIIDTDARDLLLYAAETAANAGCGGNWSYIEGILGRLRQRGITTLQEAEEYDLERREAAI